MAEQSSAPTPVPTLRELALLFLRLGATAFGGPAAHIALMEDEVVQRRRWLTREQFLDLLGATNLIPGPNSTEMALHIGLLAGWRGFLIAGVCFIMPAVFIVTFLAWLYVNFGSLPQVAGVMYGIKPVIIAVVVQALWRLGRDSLKSPPLIAIALLAIGLTILGVNELLVLLVGGTLAALFRWFTHRRTTTPTACLLLMPLPVASVVGPGFVVSFNLGTLFLVFLKIGAVLFGSGYVLLAFLRADLVERLQWIKEQQLLDAIAVGQVTPGPVFTTATFIGYLLSGPMGAAVATVGIFLPAFVFVALSGPIVPRLRRSPTAGAVLDGVVVASLALMAVVAYQLGVAAIVDVPTILIALVSALLLLRFKVNATWLIAAGATLGLVLR